EKFGVTMGIKDHNGFSATNTCPVDTALMAWHQLQRFGGTILPSDVLNTSAGDVLQKVVSEITHENYDEARFLWCTKVMKLEKGDHSLFGTLEAAFHDHLSGPSNTSRDESSTCSMELYPRPNTTAATTREFKLQSYTISNLHQINQETFDLSLVSSDSSCMEKIEDNVLKEHGKDVFQKQELTDIKTNVSSEWCTCQGWRKHGRRKFSVLSYLLALDCLEVWAVSKETQKPASILRIGGREYSLEAMMYGNGTHFC
ncbi:hypothetical protein BGZ51_008091, partial [Haplosporangium sp. Z 767]